ncbi:hypothetical protein AWC38_SpisGene5248 [Stylophora pistillata]|uniref:Uncharacterized protein n=2 Tax=Stylophora pistillata TaxID=50429 RepID=A0A2B4SJ78_STYPI|nr:hypothetical protein AWC38_SpisGene5248 [Stylophora pistillata]
MVYEDFNDALKLLPKLTYEHINLNAYSVMRVNLAAQVLSSTMAAVLKAFVPPEAAGTAKLCEMVDGFFDCLDVRSRIEHIRKRKPFLAPYTSLQDESSPATGWDALPPATDVSTEADIARVKYFRNFVYGHDEKKTSVDDATFTVYWQDIRDALVILEGATYQKEIDHLENECIDPVMLCNVRLLCECEDFNFELNDMFTMPTIVKQDKTRRTAVERILKRKKERTSSSTCLPISPRFCWYLMDWMKHLQILRSTFPALLRAENCQCHIILTSRQEGSAKISKFCDTLFQIEGFASENSHNYIKHYFKDLEAQGQKLLNDKEQNIELEELIVNPLFTAMLCLVYEDLEGSLPLSKTQLYLDITESILERFCQKQGLSHNNVNLAEVYKEELEHLGRNALDILKRDKMHIEEGEFTDIMRKSPLFEFLSVQSNNSEMRFHTYYEFSHKSIQEFFAGLDLSDQILEGEIDFERLLANEERNLKAVEPVLLFTAGILGHKSGNNALSLLKVIIKRTNLFKNLCFPSFYLCFALKCIGECSTEDSRLRLLGANLEPQALMISDDSFPVK